MSGDRRDGFVPAADERGSLVMSLDRLTIESLTLPWSKLEEIHEAIHDKRRQVEQHTTVAMESLRTVTILNAEIGALEKEFSVLMASMVSERARTQERLRALVAEWGREQVTRASGEVAAVQQQHSVSEATLREEIRVLKKELKDRTKAFEALQRKHDDMTVVLKEYRLDAVGPLLESLQGRRLVDSGSKEAMTAHLWASIKPGRPHTSVVPLPAEASHLSLNSMQTSAGRPSTPTAHHSVESSMQQQQTSALQSQQDTSLREELILLQGELAAARREARQRRVEVDVLRQAQEATASLAAGSSGAHEGMAHRLNFSETESNAGHRRTVVSSAASTSNSDTAFYQLNDISRSASTVVQSRHHSVNHIQGGMMVGNTTAMDMPGVHPSIPPPIALGLDLTAQRQHLGLAGVLVQRVIAESVAAAAGMETNDIIVAWGGRVVSKLEHITASSKAAAQVQGQCLEIKFLRPPPHIASNPGAAVQWVPVDMCEDDIHTVTLPLDSRLDGMLQHIRRDPMLMVNGGLSSASSVTRVTQ